jgi:hypothetical protein
MDASAEQITALAAELATLAKNMTSNTDPMMRKRQTRKAVMQAKSLIMKIQDPMEAVMDHIAYVSCSHHAPDSHILQVEARVLVQPY